MDSKTWQSLMVVWGLYWLLSTPNQIQGMGNLMRHFLESDTGDEE